MDIIDLANAISFPECSKKEKVNAIRCLRNVTIKLREEYYRISPKRDNIYTTPFGGPISDSIGPWPEFILRGLPCQKSKTGCCTPCFYSRMPQVARPDEEIYRSLVVQTQYILENFTDLVVANQHGPVSPVSNKNLVGMVLTPTGSFFDPIEFPPNIRNEILTLLVDHTSQNDIELALHIETHAEHIAMAAESQSEFAQTMGLLQQLNARVLFGFESSNDFVRNILYNKHLDMGTFENAIALTKSFDLGVGAFVFIGINPLNQLEIISDAVATIDYLKSQGISPVLMFHNIQPYTIQELLYVVYAHNLVEPRTLMEIVKSMLSNIGDDKEGCIDSWLIADPVGGPPTPEFHIFNSKRNITCEKCSQRIRDAVTQLRMDRRIDSFVKEYEEVNLCECAVEYYKSVEVQARENASLYERTSNVIDCAQNSLANYVNVIRPLLNNREQHIQHEDEETGVRQRFDRLAILKADLLCYGLEVDDRIKDDLIAFNSYIHEAGFVHAAHFLLENHLVNAPIAESFCHRSPYILKKRNSNYELERDKVPLVKCDVLSTPKWCHEEISQIRIGDILRPHSEVVLSGMPQYRCYFFDTGEQCAFCSLGPLQNKETVNPDIVVDAALRAYSHNDKYELNLSGGTSKTPDRSANYFSEIACKIREECDMKMSVETVPPDDFEYIDRLHESGVNALILNIEIWPDKIRKMFCPGKARIKKEHYLESIRYAVSKLGRGQVSSVLIAGLQSDQQIVEGCKALIDLGAIPTVIPFKPFDDCQLSDFKLTNPRSLLMVYEEVSKLISESGLLPQNQPGCTGCGGCSLENV